MPEPSEFELIEQQLKDLEKKKQKLLTRKAALLSQTSNQPSLNSRQKVELWLLNKAHGISE
ncbi:hypothetical protein D5018_18865 [Parashewanella curva]|uniref:Uncharacterized protein n=1 Tax=Parashewanella curva TaxID=2338552 RepID=A0A3L8PUN8_9GAMM|nr:hypothetical protein [Parashewanella curva]RLV58138.1 hypothetical protein D5018_18865 [Parashewanella curva]